VLHVFQPRCRSDSYWWRHSCLDIPLPSSPAPVRHSRPVLPKAERCLLTSQEALWRFRLPERSLEIPFLLVVSVVEPRVAFDRARIDFGRVLVGGSAQLALTLVNSEPQPFHFELDRVSLGDLSANPAGRYSSTRPCLNLVAQYINVMHMCTQPTGVRELAHITSCNLYFASVEAGRG
jgi:hypothetical protein